MKTFLQKVYEIAAKIPAGKVLTYGQLARLAGSPRAARAVGMCMSKNRDTKAVPCHRVVAADGKLTGYSMGDGIETKREMLMREGVVFTGEKVNLELSQWKTGNLVI
jgi:O-6-methylguanine DNA methyltransferase